MALKGLRVLEMAGLAPAPFCGALLSDLGAQVIRVDRPKTTTMYSDCFTRGKEAISLNLSQEQGRQVFLELCRKSDVLIDSFRPGVMEGLKIGPADVCKTNPRIIYARMSGYGQDGPFSKKAGHDINYLALSGVLSMLGGQSSRPQPPQNLLGDFGGGGLLCAFGILAALIKRGTTGHGETLDANLTDGTAYLSSWLWKARHLPVWGSHRGTGWFDGGLPWYDTYECKDGNFVAVGCLEKPFFNDLLTGLGIAGKYGQSSDLKTLRDELTSIFKTKSRDDWTTAFADLDACVTPVLSLDEAPSHPHHQTRQTFVETGLPDNAHFEPRPAPRVMPESSVRQLTDDNAPGNGQTVQHHGQHTCRVLRDLGYSEEEMQRMLKEGIAVAPEKPVVEK